MHQESVTSQKQNVTAAGSVIAAVLASSCCIGPLVLITLGASGAWIGNLTALKAYQPLFVSVTLVFLALGFWQVYGQTNATCEDEAVCRSPGKNRFVKSVLWLATVLVALALSVDLWAPYFY